MKHLHESEFVDLVEGRLEMARARHVEDCAVCAATAATVREALARAGEDRIPEPSPLFWEHFSARVSQALDNEPLPAPSWTDWLRTPRIAVAAATLVMVATLAGYAGWTWRNATIETTAPPAIEGAPLALDSADADADAWDVISAAAEALDDEDVRAVAISTRPGAADRAVLQLTDEERSELVRLLEDEMRSGS